MASKPAIVPEARSALGLAGTLILLALAIDDGTIGMLVGLISFVLIVFAMSKIPLRYSMMGLAFFAMLLPNPSEGQPTAWTPPFNLLGAVLLNHLNTIDRTGFLGLIPVSGMEIFFLVLYLIYLHRRNTRSRIDGEVVRTPKPMIQLSYLSLAASGLTWLKGMAFGGDFNFSLWQMNAVLYLPIIFLLMQAGFRGPQDHWALARVYLFAAVYKCALAVYVVNTVEMPNTILTGSTRPSYGTAHADSMLFSMCFVIVLAPLLERADRNAKRLAAVMLPILIAGTHANNRRLAWVQIGIVFLIVYLVSRETRIKRLVRRTVYASVPIAFFYISAGWNSMYGGFFKPVRILRSVVDADSDLSSKWREFENVNLIATFRSNPIFGSGYGHPYQEIIVLPEIDYFLERYIPHNSFLGLWAYGGYVGFAGLTMLWVVGVYFAMRAYRGAREPAHRVAAIVSFGAVPIYMAQCFGDLGLNTWTGMFLMGASLTVAAKLVVVTGQWHE